MLFVGIVVLVDRVSRLAPFASVLVFNPLGKWGVYAASLALGIALLGPVPGTGGAAVSLDVGRGLLVRLLLGNLLLASVAAGCGYVVVYRLAVRYESSEVAEVIEEAVEEIVNEVIDD